MGFPCNQFFSQEKKCEFDIKSFVQGKYQVEFPMFSKVEVNGPNTCDIFKYLRYNSELNENGNIKYIPWNFTKFLLDKDGKIVKMYWPNDKPAEMVPEIEKLLKA